MPNYTVKQGDTLTAIALAKGHSLPDLKAANPRIDHNRLSIGQGIALPYTENTPSQEVINTDNTNTEYDFILQSVSKDKKVSPTVLEDLMNNIGIWESDFNKKQIVPDAKQRSKGKNGFFDGPGRGAFQFEMASGSGRNKSAKTRLKRYYKEIKREQPEWLKKLPNDFDASTLTLEQQKILFLGDARMGPGNLSNLVSDKNPMTVGDWWKTRHKISGVTDDNLKEFNKQVEINRARGYQNQPVNTNRATVVE